MATTKSPRRRLPHSALEAMEPRELFSFSAQVNFQPASSAVPAGYVADTGSGFGARGNGLSYGWDAMNANTQDRGSFYSSDKRYTTFDAMQTNGKSYTWQISVPNGNYQVHVVAGDPGQLGSILKINVEGALAVNGTPSTAKRWVEGTVTVAVTDGKLTVSNAAGAVNNKIDFIDITQIVPVPTPTPTPTPTPSPTATKSIGVNLDGNVDWGTAHIWADAARDFRQWGQAGAAWNANPNLKFTADDYPLADADTISYLTNYPNGVYRLTYSGAGSIAVGGMGTLSNVIRAGNTVTADITIKHDNPDGTGGTIVLGIRNNVASNPVRDIHLWSPGYGPGQTFTTDFVRRLQPFGALRFMDWAATNNSTVVNWADRSQPTAMIQTLKGVDWESIIALANQTKHDVWINVPAMASDDYVKQLAGLFLAKLDPSLKVNLEYSNEVWNGAFQQYAYNAAQAKANTALTATDDYGRAAQQYALRTKQIGDIFRSVYGTQAARLSVVLGGQNSNTYWATTGLNYIKAKFGNPSQFFQQEAIAPYVGNDLPAAPAGGWTVDKLFPVLESFTTTTLAQWIRDAKAVATSFGLGLAAYEGGQSLTNNPAVAPAVQVAANNDRRMYTLYHDMTSVWQAAGGGMYEQFGEIGSGWGLLEDSKLAGSYKWDAVMDQILLKGDATLDGKVDYSDYLILKQDYKKSSMWWEQGDFNGDGVVNRKDLDLLYANLTALTTAQLADVTAFRAANP